MPAVWSTYLTTSILPHVGQFLDSSDHAVALQLFAWSAILPTTYVQIKQSLERLSTQHNDPKIRSKRSLLHEKFNMSKVPTDLDYIIIGSGMAGLSCAATLARLGRKVLVLEQHKDVAGGGTHMFDLKGYPFDSGLHYTVNWSVPLLALTCLKKPKDCLPFDMMLEEDGCIDKICLINQDKPDEIDTTFRMKYKETHLPQLYEMFPHEKEGLDMFMKVSNRSMEFVKVFLASRLLPKWLQKLYWALVPASIKDSAAHTAKELLPTFIKDRKLISLLSSMWIDTGARPDRASFMMTASVFRGVAMEGGCYPRGGSTEMAKELVTVIESNGGKVLIRGDVERILYDETSKRVCGVHMRSGQDIFCKKSVISSTGYRNTVTNLLPEELTTKYNIPRDIKVKQSAGFVMTNIGINCAPEAIGATRANTWHIPLSGDGDIFQPMDAFFADPLAANSPIPAFITFPSLKDTSFSKPDKTSCQMLVLVDYAWFEQFYANANADKANRMDGSDQRTEGYDACKEAWKERCLQIFLQHFPKAKDHIEMVDTSTPLSIMHYLRACQGAAVGLDVTPDRFCDVEVRDALDCITKVPGLSLTGQDTAICGVTLCQLSGVVTAFRLEGFCAAVKIVLQSVLLGND